MTATNARARATRAGLDWCDLNQLVALVGVVERGAHAPETRNLARRWQRRLRREMKRLERKEEANGFRGAHSGERGVAA